MSRYRAPRPASATYITDQGFQALTQELNTLWDRRREVVVFLSAAAAEGDRSENAEYQYRKQQLREIDRRIGYLQRRLPTLQVVSRGQDDASSLQGKVYFGARVTLVDEQDCKSCYQILGTDEFDRVKVGISVDSPMARSLLGRRVDDEIVVSTPEGDRIFWISRVRY